MVGVVGTLAVVVGLTLATGIHWFYPRTITTVAIIAVVVVATLIGRRLLPAAWRPSGVLPVVLASVAAYVFLRISVSAHWTEFVDHDVLEPFEGEVDDFPTWLFAGLGGAGLLAVVALVNRWAGRRLGDGAGS
ncbi:hypothetical protein [Geodermatophilus normandii]|uniref:Uncharacterized protein n=1 Tax=Geodermatophilus normandii TaxID=1137989 RepID=A0A6P0GFB5_9ACTN|nr:hypothetical protein [Geodermatophilus normandii]NEM05921.1 hypothetical protein [Geodermatophilus normandii]